MDIKKFKAKFDKVLKKTIENKIKETRKIISWPRITDIISYIDDFVFSGGKRIRPYLVYITYKAFGGTEDPDAIRFGCAFEMFHNMALIHDDIIDKGEKRHGILTYHRHVATLLKNSNREHIGNAQALLITADHGNCEQMGTAEHPNTAHTTNPVPFWYIENKQIQSTIADGGLADIAPTVLKLMDIPVPAEMTGRPLF